ncbi:MAG: glycosyltransferase [Niabella sp.]
MKFDGLASTNFTIAKYLAKNNEVYYIENPQTLKTYFKLKKNSKEYIARKSGLGFFSNPLLPQKIDGVNIVISKPVLPASVLPEGFLYQKLLHINEHIIANTIKKVIKSQNIKEYIFINAYNFYYPCVANKLNPSLKIYYCVDPIVGAYDKRHGIAGEKKLVEESDIVICTSKALYLEKKQQNKNTYFVPNAADIIKKHPASTLKHPTLANLNGTIIGYIGAIERRIDYKLLKTVAAENPEFQFVFVGPTYLEHIPHWFFEQQNIHHIPPVPYSEVGTIIYSFDICLIPFKKDEISNTIFPLKLFEYLGLGKPVVVTDFNEDLKEFTDNTVHFVNDTTSFNQALHNILQSDNEVLQNKRIAIAKKNTWEERVKEITRIINLYLPQK